MDEITNAILTNPDLAERVQGKTWHVVDRYYGRKSGKMVVLSDGHNMWAVAERIIYGNQTRH